MARSTTVLWTARLAVGAAATHALLFLVLHVLEPELSPAASILSDYGQTEHAPVAITAFIAFAVVWGALAVALSGASAGRSVLVGRFLFALAMAAILVAAIFPSTADPRTGSVIARVQNLVARPGLFVGVLLISIGLRGAAGWDQMARTLIVVAGTATVLLVLTVGLLLAAGLGGVGQRALFLLLYFWVWVVARQTISLSARPRAPTAREARRRAV
jgi:hypothetical protein